MVIVSFLIFSSCKFTKRESSNLETELTEKSIDTSRISILPQNEFTTFLIPKNSKYATLTSQDIKEIEILLKKCLKEYNIEQEQEFKNTVFQNPEYKIELKDWIINLDDYKRQDIASINDSGGKEVWINCF